MTNDEMNERRVIYETRLGILGYGPADIPSQTDHNMAVAEADAHIEELRNQGRTKIQKEFQMIRDSLEK